MHSLMGKKGRKGAMICKIDLHKAYDSVSWSFFIEVLLFYDILEFGEFNYVLYF